MLFVTTWEHSLLFLLLDQKLADSCGVKLAPGKGKNDEAPDGGNNSWIVLIARWQPRAALYFGLLSVASSQCILMQNNSLRRNT
jgi:hypothetical protein